MQELSPVQKDKILPHPPTQQQPLCYHMVVCVGRCCYCLNCYAFIVDTNVIIILVDFDNDNL